MIRLVRLVSLSLLFSLLLKKNSHFICLVCELILFFSFSAALSLFLHLSTLAPSHCYSAINCIAAFETKQVTPNDRCCGCKSTPCTTSKPNHIAYETNEGAGDIHVRQIVRFCRFQQENCQTLSSTNTFGVDTVFCCSSNDGY